MSRRRLALAGCLIASVPLVLGAGAVTPASAGASDFVKASRTVGGADLNGVTGAADISADGRWVAYQTGASNVASGDGNGDYDVVLFDVASKRTTMASLGGDDASFSPTVSDDGARLAFLSRADDLAPGDGDGQQNVLVWNRATGRIQRVDVAAGGGDPNGPATYAALSGDGRWVAFISAATNLVARHVHHGNVHLYLRDLTTGRTTVLDPRADDYSLNVAIDAHGQHVAYVSNTHRVGGAGCGTPGVGTNVLVYQRGRANPTCVTPGDGFGNEVSLSADGAKVAFDFTGSLVPGDGDNDNDVYLRTLSASAPRLITGAVDDAIGAAISPDGGYVAFDTADALHTGDDNGAQDAYRWKAAGGLFSRLNETADASSLGAELSRGGRYAAYQTLDLEYFPGDDNGFNDIYRRRFSS